MPSNVLQAYLDAHNFPVVVKKKRKYLVYEGWQDRFIYVLKKGIIKTSVISHDGREFNMEYINSLEIVSLLKDEYSQLIDSPFNIRIESETAELYQIDRVKFWKDVNQNPDLQNYVKDFYRFKLLHSMKKMQQMLMNGKFGAVCTQLNELYRLFGKKLPNGEVLIDFEVTNEDIARFCGITAASSVNRMMNQLRQAGAIRMEKRKIVITNFSIIQDHIIF